jgi:hypothetical protein
VVGNDARLSGPDVVAGAAVDPGSGTAGLLEGEAAGAAEGGREVAAAVESADADTDEDVDGSAELHPVAVSSAAAIATTVVTRVPRCLTGPG